MALSGLDIYKLLPKTNCKECGFPTCLAFAMKLAQKGTELDKCPYVSDEAKTALEAHLARLGHDYGDFPAHDGLWDMAERTRDDLLARLALVPRTLEARGLDACPLVRHKLASVGDQEGAAIIDIILRDEIGHVALGNKWYRWECARRGLDPVLVYARLAEDYRAPKLRGPLNMEARLAAGFAPEELEAIAPGGTPGRD